MSRYELDFITAAYLKVPKHVWNEIYPFMSGFAEGNGNIVVNAETALELLEEDGRDFTTLYLLLTRAQKEAGGDVFIWYD